MIFLHRKPLLASTTIDLFAIDSPLHSCSRRSAANTSCNVPYLPLPAFQRRTSITAQASSARMPSSLWSAEQAHGVNRVTSAHTLNSDWSVYTWMRIGFFGTSVSSSCCVRKYLVIEALRAVRYWMIEVSGPIVGSGSVCEAGLPAAADMDDDILIWPWSPRSLLPLQGTSLCA